MCNKLKQAGCITLLLFLLFSFKVQATPSAYKLWYKQPASEWMQSLPLGNGRLGLTVFGGIESETVSLNEITMWSGQYDPFQERPVGKELLNEIRQLFFAGDYIRGNDIGSKFLSGLPHSFGSHVPVGDLKIDFQLPQGKVSNYNRTLDLHTAINTVSFTAGGVQYNREYFCSNPDDATVIRLSANKKAALNCAVYFNLLREAQLVETANGLEFTGKVSFPRQGPGGVNFMGKVSVTIDNGSLSVKDGKINISNAQNAVIVKAIEGYPLV